MEGQVQKTQKLPFAAKQKYIFEYLKYTEDIKNNISGILEYNHNNLNFVKYLYYLNFLTYKKFCKSFLKTPFVNYFASNFFLKNSRTLNKCSLLFNQKYENFI